MKIKVKPISNFRKTICCVSFATERAIENIVYEYSKKIAATAMIDEMEHLKKEAKKYSKKEKKICDALANRLIKAYKEYL